MKGLELKHTVMQENHDLISCIRRKWRNHCNLHSSLSKSLRNMIFIKVNFNPKLHETKHFMWTFLKQYLYTYISELKIVVPVDNGIKSWNQWNICQRVSSLLDHFFEYFVASAWHPHPWHHLKQWKKIDYVNEDYDFIFPYVKK